MVFWIWFVELEEIEFEVEVGVCYDVFEFGDVDDVGVEYVLVEGDCVFGIWDG